MNFERLKKLFVFFNKRKVKAVLLTGGEPLIRKDFDKILEELRKYKFKIFLDTNGDLFFEHKDAILKYVDIIGLPVDFSDSSYRNRYNLRNILEILQYFKKLKKHPRIRIGTVVTKDNFKKLREIGELIKKYPIDIWKIYQFLPQNLNALKNKSSLEVSQKQFNLVAEKMENSFSGFFKVIISKRENRNRAYFSIDPDGMVSVPIDDNLSVCEQKKVGNVFDNDIVEKWEKIVFKENYLNNASETFHYKFL